MTFTPIEGPTIPAGESVSEAINLLDHAIARIAMPDEWDTKAPLTFLLSLDGVTFRDAYFTDGKEIALQVVPGATVLIPIQCSLHYGCVNFRTSSASNP